MALSQAEKDQLNDWARRIDTAGATAATSHQRVLRSVVTEMQAVAAGETTVKDLATSEDDTNGG